MLRTFALLGLALALNACCGVADPPDGSAGVIYDGGGDASSSDAATPDAASPDAAPDAAMPH